MTRRAAVLAVAAAAVALLAVAAAPWLAVPASTALSAEVLQVAGGQAVPAVPAAGVVLLAAALALALAGRVAQVLAAATVTLAGVVVLVSTGALVRSPGAVGSAAVAAATGVRPAEAEVSLTLWPVVAGALGAATCVLGVAAAVRRWRGTRAAHRYEDARARGLAPVPREGGGHDRARHDWDALTRGEDPS